MLGRTLGISHAPDKAGTVIAARLVRCDEGIHPYCNRIQGYDGFHGVGFDDGGSIGVGGAISTQSGRHMQLD